MKTPTIVTHNGPFQPDEVFAVAVLHLLFPETTVVRSRRDEVIAAGDYVVDVGDVYDVATNRFDHHQKGGAGTRENGIRYSAFGLVWKTYGVTLCGNEAIAQKIEQKLVQAIDADDGGVDMYAEMTIKPYGIEELIYSLMPSWNEPEELFDVHFMQAVAIAKLLLTREITLARDKAAARELVEEAYRKAEDKRIIVLDGPYPSGEVLEQYPEPLIIIKPRRQNAEWGIKMVSVSANSFDSRTLLPEAWGGLRDTALQAVTGVPDAIFCHKDRWAAAAVSKEGAISLAKLALTQ